MTSAAVNDRAGPRIGAPTLSRWRSRRSPAQAQTATPAMVTMLPAMISTPLRRNGPSCELPFAHAIGIEVESQAGSARKCHMAIARQRLAAEQFPEQRVIVERCAFFGGREIFGHGRVQV